MQIASIVGTTPQAGGVGWNASSYAGTSNPSTLLTITGEYLGLDKLPSDSLYAGPYSSLIRVWVYNPNPASPSTACPAIECTGVNVLSTSANTLTCNTPATTGAAAPVCESSFPCLPDIFCHANSNDLAPFRCQQTSKWAT